MADTEVQPRLTDQLPVSQGRLRGHAGATADDARLVAGVRAGEPGALEAVFDRHGPALLSFCRHMLGSREDAEDALQHVMLSAHRALLRSQAEIHLRAWLFAIARNRCRSMLRARRVDVPLDDVSPSTEGLAAEVERREDLRAMLGDLRRLPEDQRAALLLAELGARSHQEIATVLEVRPAKVKALVFQAREALAAARAARETPCAEIREQLATLRGSALRRGVLRRHVEACAGCRAFEAEVACQRAAFAILLPVAPSAALKSTVLGAAAVGAGGAAAGGIAGGGLVALGQGGAAKLLAVAALVGAAGGGGYVAVTDHDRPAKATPAHAAPAPAPAPKPRAPASPAAGRLPVPALGTRSSPAPPAGARPAPAGSRSPRRGSAVSGSKKPGRPAASDRAAVAPQPPAGRPGASGSAPGHTKQPSAGAPGASGSAPGHTMQPSAGAPGASGSAPGHNKQPSAATPGASGSAPGHTKRADSGSPGAGGSAPGHTKRGAGGTAGSRPPQPPPVPASGRPAAPAAGQNGQATGPPPASEGSDPAGAPLANAPADHSDSGGHASPEPPAAPSSHGNHGRPGGSRTAAKSSSPSSAG